MRDLRILLLCISFFACASWARPTCVAVAQGDATAAPTAAQFDAFRTKIEGLTAPSDISAFLAGNLDCANNKLTTDQAGFYDRLLLALYRQYYVARACESGDANAQSRCKRDADTLFRTLRAYMGDAGMINALAATLFAGTTIADTGSSTVPSLLPETQNITLGTVKIESSHFGHEASPLDLSVIGDFGFAPVLAAFDLTATNAAGSSAPQPTLRSSFVQAFNWDTGIRVSGGAGESGEYFGVARVGQTRLDNTVNSFRSADGTTTFTANLANNSDRTAGFWQLGGGIRLFGQPLDQVEVEKTFFSPLIYAEAGYLDDQRLVNRGTDLAGLGPHTSNRSYVSVLFTLLNVKGLGSGSGSSPVSLTFGVDYQGPWLGRGTKWPSGTAIVISSNVDVMSLLKGGSK